MKAEELLKQIEEVLLETSNDEGAMSGEHILADELLDMIKNNKEEV